MNINGNVSHSFSGIYLNIGTSTPSSVQNNTIQNINYASTSPTPWFGINVNAGTVNIGTITGNKIGEATGTGSITVTNTSANAFFICNLYSQYRNSHN